MTISTNGRRITTKEATVKTAAVEVKTCTGCHTAKPLSEFPTKNASPDGVSSRCKVCSKAYHQQWHRDNPNGGFRKAAHLAMLKSRMAKPCSNCLEEKPLEAFHKLRSSADGYHYLCKVCSAQKQQERKTRQPELLAAVARRHKLKKQYGLTAEQYDRMVIAQNGLCAICHQPPGNLGLVIDHNHETGRVRGLLCENCNRRLEGIEQPGFVVAAMTYLVQYDTIHMHVEQMKAEISAARARLQEQHNALEALDQLFIAV